MIRSPFTKHHAVQRRVWDERKRFVAIAAGRRAGKTEIAIWHTIAQALSYLETPPTTHSIADARFGFGAPTLPQARRIFWDRLKAAIPHNWLLGKPVETRLELRLIWGPTLVVAGMDEPARIEGVGWDGFVLDEFANMKPHVWTRHVRPALADRQGFGWNIGVPEGRNHFYDLAMDYMEREECGFYTWSSRSILPPEEIAQLERDMDPKSVRQELDASFEEASGRIYYAFDQNLDVMSFALPPGIGTEARPWYGGMDFNVNPMCAVWGWETEVMDFASGRTDTHVWIWDEAFIPHSNTRSTAKEIRERCDKTVRFGEFNLYPDATGDRGETVGKLGQTDLSILRDCGFRVHARRSNPLRRDRYNTVNSMFCTGDARRRVHIHPRCVKLIKSLEGLVYKEGTSDPDKSVKCALTPGSPKGEMDHPTDALGYWLYTRHRVGNMLGQVDPNIKAA